MFAESGQRRATDRVARSLGPPSCRLVEQMFEVVLTAQLSNPLPSLPKLARPMIRRDVRQTRVTRLSKREVEELCCAYAAGASVVHLAKEYDIHRQTVNAHLERSGLTLRPKRSLTEEDTDVAADRYLRGESCAALAKDFEVDPSTVRNALQRHGVTLRPRPGWTYP